MKTNRILALVLLGLSTLNPQLSTLLAQGSLTPSGPPGPTMKTLAQVEPRTPISSLPFLITNAGSYYATTNLVGVSNGITIAASGVTIDLMGFEVVGVGARVGSGVGVLVSRTNICVRNGTLRGWGLGLGARNAINSQFDGLRASSNGAAAIWVGRSCVVRDCVVMDSELDGIVTGDGSVVRQCTAIRSEVGIRVASDCKVIDCMAVSNTFFGIIARNSSTVTACTANGNGTAGIDVGDHCRVTENHCYGNGSGPNGAGIYTSGSQSVFEGNSLIANQRGIWADRINGRNLVVRNMARNNFLTGVGNRNYDIAPGNRVAQTVLLPANAAAFTGETGGSASGTTDPWSNISY